MEAVLEKSKSQKAYETRRIRKVAILGAGVMGSRIACHFANIGVEALLLDIVPKDLSPEEQAKGLTLDSPIVRNRIVNTAFQNTLKAKPAALYNEKFANRIKLGNFEDNMAEIANADWVIEVVMERLDIKQKVFEQVEKYRKKGTLITSNTSGIPINMMTEGRSDDFKAHFCGTHFFNPPRYLKLLEIIPTAFTKPEVIDFLMDYGAQMLGKTTVLCKDTPAFIANRVGVYAIMDALHTIEQMGLSVEAVDKLTGSVLGRPKSATFRTLDVVGLDTMILVAGGLAANAPHDEAKEAFQLPKSLAFLKEQNWLGDKSGQGYYKKDKNTKEIFALDLNTFEYKPQEKVKFKALEATKMIEKVKERFPVLLKSDDQAGEFYRKTFASLFAYVANRIPEIADHLYQIDDAICAGFGWEVGPFETWDAVGIEYGLQLAKEAGKTIAPWVQEMLEAGNDSFYKLENGKQLYYDVATKTYKPIQKSGEIIILDNIRKTNKVWGNIGSTLFDLGDGILGLEFHTKMNAIGAEVIEGINKAIETAEKDFRGLVIGSNAENFSAGANLAMLMMFAFEQDWDEVNLMIAQFQKAMMRTRYSAIPVVTAPAGLALGGGCELNLHADHIQAHAETYMGLVEFGVGLIPAGGGSKEMTVRVSDSFKEGDVEFNSLQTAFMNIATAKVATSAHEAMEMGYLRRGDGISLNRAFHLAEAKLKAIELAELGYTQPKQRTDVKVLGKGALGTLKAGITGMLYGKYISEHDAKIAEKLAYVMTGGDLSMPQMVSEQYLLDLEREAFLSLCGEKKTLERIQSILTTGKPLRN
ncbi:MAG: 3-hydroxyacyl-CoA dehydrogenase/enoyl-CoA hydratase family protein [Thermonemataceae bacterium]|nr:3-hydroxyacyl-CoA dehydrogenase/enoyl-CoA hydratase family protein [Thermonemataceae bacterium]